MVSNDTDTVELCRRLERGQLAFKSRLLRGQSEVGNRQQKGIYRVTVKSCLYLFCLYLLYLKEHRKIVTARSKLRFRSLCGYVENVNSGKKIPLWRKNEKIIPFSPF
jgi:hypothetical protein